MERGYLDGISKKGDMPDSLRQEGLWESDKDKDIIIAE